jgi:signal transduction histidine kinase
MFFYGGLGDTYRDQGDYNEALKYNSKITELIVRYEQCKWCRAPFTGRAAIYIEKHQLDSARYFLQKAFLYPPVKIGSVDGWVYATSGRIHTELRNYDSALMFYRQSILAHKQDKNIKDLANAYNYIAALFKTIGSKDSSLFYARQALSISKPKKFTKEILETTLLLSNIYEPLNTDSTLHYYKQAMMAKDSLYNQNKQRQILSYKFNEERRQQERKHTEEKYNNQLKIYALIVTGVIFLITAVLLWLNNQHRRKAYTLLQRQKLETENQKSKVEQTLSELKRTQTQLIQSEKMASLGELTAGIAHEIQNPLNFVNNFSEVSNELIKEIKDERRKTKDERDEDLENELLTDISQNLEKINHHGKRADAIVKGMLDHSRKSTGEKVPTDINALADEYLRLSYHGMRAKDKSFNADFVTDFDPNLPKVNVVPQDIGRVLLNIINNAFQAVGSRHALNLQPTVTVSTKNLGDRIQISVSDNGPGIPDAIKEKIFQPFFTTKPTGSGTGLGLSLSYDIVKAHGGELKVESVEGKGSTFIILLP